MNFDEPIDRNQFPTMKWSRAFLEEHFGNGDAIPMSVADMDFQSPPAVVEQLKKRAAHGVFGYEYRPESFLNALKKWYQTRHGWAIDQEHLEQCPSIMNAISILIDQHSTVGDGVILQSPVFFEFRMVIKSSGRRIVKNSLKLEAGRYEIDFDDLAQKTAVPTSSHQRFFSVSSQPLQGSSSHPANSSCCKLASDHSFRRGNTFAGGNDSWLGQYSCALTSHHQPSKVSGRPHTTGLSAWASHGSKTYGVNPKARPITRWDHFFAGVSSNVSGSNKMEVRCVVSDSPNKRPTSQDGRFPNKLHKNSETNARFSAYTSVTTACCQTSGIKASVRPGSAICHPFSPSDRLVALVMAAAKAPQKAEKSEKR